MDEQSAHRIYSFINNFIGVFRLARKYPSFEDRLFFGGATGPMLLPLPEDDIAEDLHFNHSSLYAINQRGQLLVMGENYEGQLGCGGRGNLEEFEDSQLFGVERLQAGRRFAVARAGGAWFGTGMCSLGQFPSLENARRARESLEPTKKFSNWTFLTLPGPISEVWTSDFNSFFADEKRRTLFATGPNFSGQTGVPQFKSTSLLEATRGFSLDLMVDSAEDERIIEVSSSILSSLVLTDKSLYFFGRMEDNALPSHLTRDSEIPFTSGTRVLLDRLADGLEASQIASVTHKLGRSALVLKDGRAVLFGGKLGDYHFPVQIFEPRAFEGLSIKMIEFGKEWELVYCEEGRDSEAEPKVLEDKKVEFHNN